MLSLILLITVIRAIKIFKFMEQICFGDCLLCVRIKGIKYLKGMIVLKNKKMLKIGMCVGILGLSITSLVTFTGGALQVEAKEKTGQVKHKNQATHKEFSQLEKNLMLD